MVYNMVFNKMIKQYRAWEEYVYSYGVLEKKKRRKNIIALSLNSFVIY